MEGAPGIWELRVGDNYRIASSLPVKARSYGAPGPTTFCDNRDASYFFLTFAS